MKKILLYLNTLMDKVPEKFQFPVFAFVVFGPLIMLSPRWGLVINLLGGAILLLLALIRIPYLFKH